ncbi:hypothetical protein GDO78_010644 [Eleutherodactylus coqui]|uniref:Uncharacterized protein n=1 Tax=Eleutherodactylus coqui TaxID=57060 RepID=A0A8J6K718_ELECQ|nr:hypothetical protein GDO78_010644 [Eleutherodactylus coqui]
MFPLQYELGQSRSCHLWSLNLDTLVLELRFPANHQTGIKCEPFLQPVRRLTPDKQYVCGAKFLSVSPNLYK